MADLVQRKSDSERQFLQALKATGSATTEVVTDPQVFERITLGLYREPASAIRELISNAYDADASWVKISTGQPHFRSISVEDDGSGLSPSAIDYLVHHVGGSLKASERGKDAGVTDSVGLSPHGRSLIGQMGIGLYSVARLTRRFTIATKRKGDDHRFVLDIDLTGLDRDALPEEDADKYIAGYARLVRQPVEPREITKHGTRIVLHDILAEAKHVLQSGDRWSVFLSNATKLAKGELKYHIGRPQSGISANLPWEEDGRTNRTPLDKFKALVQALSTPAESSGTSPSLDQTLDYYLAMIWKISLSAPLRYLEKHPFSLGTKDHVDFYSLKGDTTPELVALPDDTSIGDHLGVHEVGSTRLPFNIEIDGVELRRPIVFRPFQQDARRLLERPKLFVGHFESTREGANLAGTGYFFWSYDIIPKENNGSLVRVAGSSGTLFDPRFLNFRTSENLRLRQVSGEMFVERGLREAINIDRESFVETDPSVRALQRWTHRSMTRIFTRLKMDQKVVATEKRGDIESQTIDEAENIAERVWVERRESSRPPHVVVSSKYYPPSNLSAGTIFIGDIPSDRRGGIEKETVFAARLRAIVTLLDAYKLLDDLPPADRNSLIREISSILDRK